MRRRSGFSLIEVMISITILLVIMGAAVQFLRRQSNAVATQSQRMDALQNAQFAASEIERELREAGAGVADAQPMIVQLDANAITFNANLVSSDPNDVRAVYRSADADTAATRAMLPGEKLPLPDSPTLRMYPDSAYWASRGVPSGAETISYYLVPDVGATTPNTYALWRRANATSSTLVARGLIRDTVPFFTYYTQGTANALKAIPASALPLYHVPLHGSLLDVDGSATTDSVRVVRVHFAAVTVDPLAGRDSVKYRVVETVVRLMNAGLLHLSACGARPVPAPAPAVSQSSPTPGVHVVTVTWARSGDDGAGEKDIERYAVFRRLASATQMNDPIASIPASPTGSYAFSDGGVVPGASYVYGVAAQDCTPTMSDITSSNPITISNP